MRAGILCWASPVWLVGQFTLLEEPLTATPEQHFPLSAHGFHSRAACSQQRWKGHNFKALLVGGKQGKQVFSFCLFCGLFYSAHWCEAERQNQKDQKNGGLGTDSSEPELPFCNVTFTGFVREFPFWSRCASPQSYHLSIGDGRQNQRTGFSRNALGALELQRTTGIVLIPSPQAGDVKALQLCLTGQGQTFHPMLQSHGQSLWQWLCTMETEQSTEQVQEGAVKCG